MSPKQPKKKKKRYTSPAIKTVSEKGLTKDTKSAFMTGGCSTGAAVK